MEISRDSFYLEDLLENTPFGIFSTDKNFRVIVFNREAERITGFKADEVAGKRLNSLIGISVIREFSHRLRKEKNCFFIDIFSAVLLKGGGTSRVRMVLSPILNKWGLFEGVLVLADALGEFKHLYEGMIEAERASAINETAVSFNHEINNPLCSILGNTQLVLMEKGLDGAVVEKLKRIEKDITRIQRIAGKLARITRPVLREYVSGRNMIDLERSEITSKE